MIEQAHDKPSPGDSATSPADNDLTLELTLDECLKPPTDQHSLLVGFHFETASKPHDHPAVVSLNLDPLNQKRLFECWWYRGDVGHRTFGTAMISECDDYAVVTVQKTEAASGDFREFAYEAYRELLRAVRSAKHTRIVKIWNYFAGINSGDGDLEKYRQFSAGRAKAFAELGIRDEEAPTGTAIGTLSGDAFTLIALASNRDFRSAENPRQVSAFNYPRRYGPSSPKFSRSGYVSTGNHRLFLLSGTAAVVGHKSVSPYNAEMQTDETLRNLELICEAVSILGPGGPHLVLDEESVLRVYLRDPKDFETVSRKLETALGCSSRRVAFLQGNICRRELVVEIDGVKIVRDRGGQ